MTLTNGGQLRPPAVFGPRRERLQECHEGGFLLRGKDEPERLASLWKVYDRSTATLMERFYTHGAAGLSKAEALRAAQLEQIRAGERPLLWAAFELHGDGR